MIILGIESTCDETGAAVVADGRKILSNVIYSSAARYKKWGGVVPEIAAREQIRDIIPVITRALHLADYRIDQIDAFAISYGPGLIGSLLIGVETIKVLALVIDKPLFAVNHLVGHVYANWIVNRESLIVHRKSQESNERSTINNTPSFPLVALIVSGGHTDLILMTSHIKFRRLGGTRDDAAGEIFDKVARVLGLGYPGGPEIEKIASNFQIRNSPFDKKLAQGKQFEIRNLHFPRPMINSGDFDFSFSGLKTAVANLVRSIELTFDVKTHIAYEFQEAIVDVLVSKTILAAKKFSVKSIVVGGGVAANSRLKEKMSQIGESNNMSVLFPTKKLAIDNGAMIAAAAYYLGNESDPLLLQPQPSLYL